MRAFAAALLLAGLGPWARAVFAQEAPAASAYLPTLSSYTQVWYLDTQDLGDRWALRRLKLMADGGPGDGVRYHVQFIYKTHLQSPTDDHVFLQDANATIPACGGLTFKAGQFVPPFGLERFQPDWKLDLVDRTGVTNRMVVNGNLGKSFARDRGIQADWARGGLAITAGLFQGEGANMNSEGNGPLGVIRLTCGSRGRAGGKEWRWSAGAAASDRHDVDMDFSPQFPGLAPARTRHFAGRDRRGNVFLEGGWGKVRGQAEMFRTWLSPREGPGVAARGGYVQAAFLPVPAVILALRREWFTPDLNDPSAPGQDLWTAGVTVDVPRTSLRLACDYSHPVNSWPNNPGDVVRFQLQVWFPSWGPRRRSSRSAEPGRRGGGPSG